MNYNDKIMSQQDNLLTSSQVQFYDNKILKQSTQNSKIMIKSNQPNDYCKKLTLSKGKENQIQNINQNDNKNIVTNHSFNGFFNENNKLFKKNVRQSQELKFNSKQFAQYKAPLQINVNSPTNFNSSGKLSNLYFVNDSISKSQDLVFNPQITNFMKKYFPLNFQTGNYYGQYVTLQDFVQIVFEDFQHLLGDKAANLINQFAEKIFTIFGDKIYFEDFFHKTAENGLSGIVLEVLKSIQQDKNLRKDSDNKQNRNLSKSNASQQIIFPSAKDSRLQKRKTNSGFSNILKSKIPSNNSQPLILDRSRLTPLSINPQPLILERSSSSNTITQKISLDNFFRNNNNSKVQFYEDQTTIIGYNNYDEQNIQEIKIILQDYIQAMYQQSQSKLNKKYFQQIKKITQKYKQTQKLLQKINEKISNYYDCLELEKNYQKKFKTMVEKQNSINQKIIGLENQLKLTKDQLEKQKISHEKTAKELSKVKEKLEKYQIAIFQKAMEQNTSKFSLQSINLQKNNQNLSNCISNSTIADKPIEKSRFQIRVDTFSQHRPSISPLKIHTPPIYTSYFTKKTLSPVNQKKRNQYQRSVSTSPIKQRISFAKTQNPTMQPKAPSFNTNKDSNASINENMHFTNKTPIQSNSTQNNPYYYQNCQTKNTYTSHISNNAVFSTQNSFNENNLKISNVQKIEIGQPIQLRPLSPIGKLGQTSKTYCPSVNQNYQYGYQQKIGNQYSNNKRSYSPIRVQFGSSNINSNNGTFNK